MTALATAALVSGQFEAASVLAREAVRDEPRRIDAYLVLGLALDHLSEHTAAADAYRVVVHMSGSRRRYLLLLARALRRSADIDGAVRVYERVRQVACAQGKTALTASR